MRRWRSGVAVAAALLLALSLAAPAVAASDHRTVQLRDACDGPTFNAAIGPGACAREDGVTFDEFIGQLLSMGQAPAWRFSPSDFEIDAGGTIDAYNRGGEFHTFTEVKSFGGGCVPVLNALLGLTAVPECADAGTLFATTGAAPGGEVTTGPLPAGIHRFQCLIHPWMRATVDAG
jgi:plastocyanin